MLVELVFDTLKFGDDGCSRVEVIFRRQEPHQHLLHQSLVSREIDTVAGIHQQTVVLLQQHTQPPIKKSISQLEISI